MSLRIIVHSNEGDGLGLALRLFDEGHDVGWYVTEPKLRSIGLGLLPGVEGEDFITCAKKADLVIFDQVGFGALADLLREHGCAVFGASAFQDKLELDRIAAMRLFKHTPGLTIPRTIAFDAGAFEEAEEFVRRDGGRWVFKACGNVAVDKTFIAEDAEEMVEYLEHLDATIEGEEGRRPPFMLQEFVKGIEVSTEIWVAHGKPVPSLYNSTFERKKFLAGDLGPATGGEGNTVLPHRDRKLLDATVDALRPLFAEFEISSCIDLNAIVAESDHRVYILEATARIGYPASQTFLSMWKANIGETLLAIAEGDVPTVPMRAATSAGVVVSIPPYPSADATEAKDTPVVDDVLSDPAIWPGDIMLTESKDRVVCAGGHGIIYVRTGLGQSIREAWRRVYDPLEESRLPDRQYRNDLERTGIEELATLRQWGYLTDRRGAV